MMNRRFEGSRRSRRYKTRNERILQIADRRRCGSRNEVLPRCGHRGVQEPRSIGSRPLVVEHDVGSFAPGDVCDGRDRAEWTCSFEERGEELLLTSDAFEVGLAELSSRSAGPGNGECLATEEALPTASGFEAGGVVAGNASRQPDSAVPSNHACKRAHSNLGIVVYRDVESPSSGLDHEPRPAIAESPTESLATNSWNPNQNVPWDSH